jgi:predicted AAA+ superfamily ATPase
VIRRLEQIAAVRRLLAENRVVALLGARQVGKTTLARQIAKDYGAPVHHFDLESARDLSKLEDPLLALEPLRGLVVLDEVQRRPEIFPALRVLSDRKRGTRFLILGSASPNLLRQTSETLAGRIAFHELSGFSLGEITRARSTDLWLRGGFPRAFLAKSAAQSMQWRRDFISTFLERDLPQLGVRVPAPTLRRFWSMLAHVHGQILNWSELGRSMSVTDVTVRHYLDVLSSTFMVRLLAPWHENLAKRQVKAPKVHLRDSGLLHALLDIGTAAQLDGHPRLGASWEGFCIESLILRLGVRPEQCYFWATHAGAELDLLVVAGGRRRGFEMKRTVAPRVTASMQVAIRDLKLDSLDVIHAGNETFPLTSGIRAVGLPRLLADIAPIRGA